MGHKPSYYLHNGFRMPMGFPPDGFESGLTYQAQKGDVFLVTYPKCGTTWTQYIVWLLLHQGQPLLPNQRLDQVFPHLEEVGKEVVQQLPIPRLIKTHLPYKLTPYHPQAKYLYIVRNPFDCVVSFYHHTRGFIEHYNFADGTFDQFFECFIKGEVDFGDYFDHLLGWYPQSAQDNCICLTYESMQQDIKQAILKIAHFLGGRFLENANQALILEEVIKQSHFSQMKKDQQRWSSQRPEKMPPFIRKGQVGDGDNYLSDEQKERLKQRFLDKTKGTDIIQLWPNLFNYEL
ncbi:MAG: sulfotransferase domain-containing protein [Microcystaceae cyanobacterium]